MKKLLDVCLLCLFLAATMLLLIGLPVVIGITLGSLIVLHRDLLLHQYMVLVEWCGVSAAKTLFKLRGMTALSTHENYSTIEMGAWLHEMLGVPTDA